MQQPSLVPIAPAPHPPILHEDEFCGSCFEGGEMLCCDGPCKRAFHLACLHLTELPQEDPWYCFHCRHLKQQNLIESDPTSQQNHPKFKAILDAVEQLRDKSTGDLRARFFRFLPLPYELPGYYETITQPISLQHIRRKVYGSPDDFRNDFRLLVKNATTFNPKETAAHNDAKALERLFSAEWNKHFPEVPYNPDSLKPKSKRTPVKKRPSDEDESTLDDDDEEVEVFEEDWESDEEEKFLKKMKGNRQMQRQQSKLKNEEDRKSKKQRRDGPAQMVSPSHVQQPPPNSLQAKPGATMAMPPQYIQQQMSPVQLQQAQLAQYQQQQLAQFQQQQQAARNAAAAQVNNRGMYSNATQVPMPMANSMSQFSYGAPPPMYMNQVQPPPSLYGTNGASLTAIGGVPLGAGVVNPGMLNGNGMYQQQAQQAQQQVQQTQQQVQLAQQQAQQAQQQAQQAQQQAYMLGFNSQQPQPQPFSTPMPPLPLLQSLESGRNRTLDDFLPPTFDS